MEEGKAEAPQASVGDGGNIEIGVNDVQLSDAQIRQLVERMKAEGDDPAEYVDITIKVSERKYVAWPSHIRSAFEGARTVRVGKASYEISLNDQVQS